MKPLRKWMLLATTEEQTELAKLSGTSREYLYQLVNGIREASSGMAGKIEEASRKLRKGTKNRLAVLTRADISSVCSECSYAKKCLKNKGKL